LHADLSETFLKQSLRKVNILVNGKGAKEGSSLVCEIDFNCHVALKQILLRKLQRIICVLLKSRLILVALHGPHAEQVQGDGSAFPVESDLVPHSREAVLHDTLQLFVLSLHDHLLVFLRLLRVLDQVGEGGDRWLLGRVEVLLVSQCLFLGSEQVFQVL